MVDDQDKARDFYTRVLGFRKKVEFTVGEYKWITVVSADGPGEMQLALERNANPAGKIYQEALFEQGVPATAFESTDIVAECAACHGQRTLRPNGSWQPLGLHIASRQPGSLQP